MLKAVTRDYAFFKKKKKKKKKVTACYSKAISDQQQFKNRTVIPLLFPYWWANHCFGY